MQPEIDIGPVTLQTFGLMFALSFIVAGAIVAKQLGELEAADWAYEMVFAADRRHRGRADRLPDPELVEVSDDLLGNIFTGSGWSGSAAIGGAAAVCLWARWRGMLNWGLADLCSAPLAAGYAVGRIGLPALG